MFKISDSVRKELQDEEFISAENGCDCA